MLQLGNVPKTPRLELVAEALQRLADAGADVSRVGVEIREEAIALVRDRHKLMVLPASLPPSVGVIVAELITFLLPLQDTVVQRIAQALSDTAPLRLDPLVDVGTMDSTIAIETRYATRHNVTQRALYPSPMRHRCFVRRSVAGALHRVQTVLRREGYGLKLWDGYRPHAIQRQCADPRVIPDAAIRQLFAPPSRGSNHARGCAVDVTLVDLKNGQACMMPTEFDSASPAAGSHATKGLAREQIENRQRLQAAMTQADFFTIPTEWWHFNYRTDHQQDKSRNVGDLYLVLDVPFDALLSM